jgi:hypothetical protein
MDDAARVALDLPQTTEIERHGHRAWAVGGKVFAWERPFSKADVRRFGEQAPPDGPILAVSVEDLGEKQAVLEAQPGALFTIAHFDNYPAVLVHLGSVSAATLRETLVDGWLTVAPRQLAEEFLAADR